MKDTIPSDTSRPLKLWVILSRAHAAVERQAHADIESHGLTPGEFAVLDVLFHKGPLLLGEIRDKVLVSSGGITYLVDRLVKQGLVERQECARDRRACYAALTEAGMVRMQEIFPQHARAVTEALDGLSAEEQEMAIRLLRTLGRSAAER